jgi:hypothetical protein
VGKRWVKRTHVSRRARFLIPLRNAWRRLTSPALGCAARRSHPNRLPGAPVRQARATASANGERHSGLLRYALIDEVERIKANIRNKVEHPFRVIKRQFGFVKVRYRGLMKNTTRLATLFALSKLWIARGKLMEVAGLECVR